MTWRRTPSSSDAADAILDAAGELFLRDGVHATGMTAIADAAGCSRATLYRYFPDRDVLRQAYVDREADRIGAQVAATVASVAEPRRRLAEAIETTLDLVRSSPPLVAWFTAEDQGLAHGLANSSEVVASLIGAPPSERSDGAAGAQRGAHAAGADGRWVVRVIVSLLAVPAAPDEERAIIERFVVEPLLGERSAPQSPEA